MTEPELEGMGASSASRRKFMWLGGGVVASLLLLPEFSLAAKVTKAVKPAATGRSGKAAKSAGATSTGRSAKGRKAEPGATAKSGGAKGKSLDRTPSGRRAPRAPRDVPRNRSTTKKSKGGNGRQARVTRRRAVAARSRRVPMSSSPPRISSCRPPTRRGRAFSFGAGSPESRALSLFCVHTGEQLKIDYYVDGRYEPDALAAIDHLLRDYHNDEICQFDPRVLNQLYDLRRALGSSEPFHVFSGYRSPETNESYRRLSGRVAEHSYHMTGQAIDIQLPGRDVRQLRNVAVAMRAGGVGYYPQDGFLHLDSGPVRRW